ncbi:MAG: nucleotidyltransferase domain-containing protein [Desulfobacterales bacterium]|nr:nucleotidyltransferase domain-containing protein [Desulfobacterales bacterium]
MKHQDLTGKIIDCAPKILERFPVLFAYLYGSHAAGDAHAASDVDIAVFLANNTIDEAMRLESTIALAFDDALGHTVETDVRSMNEAPLVLQGEVATKGILLYSSDERARVEFETRVRMAYFDFQPTIKAYQEAYIAGILNE